MKNKIYTIRWRELTRFKPYDHDDDGKKESCEDLCRSRLARRVILSPLVLFVLSAEPDKIMGHLRAMEFFAASAEKIFSQNEVIFKSCRRIFLAWIRNDGESFVCFFAIEWNFTFGTSGSDILSRWFFFFFWAPIRARIHINLTWGECESSPPFPSFCDVKIVSWIYF